MCRKIHADDRFYTIVRQSALLVVTSFAGEGTGGRVRDLPSKRSKRRPFIVPYFTGVPDGAARLKTRSAGWNRAGCELNTLDG